MGCICCSLSSFVSIVLDALERISLCTVCALLTCCLLATIITVMVLGIGIGYNYCFVQNSVESTEKSSSSLRSGPERIGSGNIMRSMDRAVQRGLTHIIARREAEVPLSTDNNITTSLIESKITFSNITNLAGATLI